VPEVKNLNEVGGFVDSIIDQDGSVHELADAGASIHWAADVREAF